MIKTFLYSMFAVFLFALGAAGSWFYLQMEDAAEPADGLADSQPVVAAPPAGIESLTRDVSLLRETEMPVPVPSKPISADELFRQTAMNKDYHERLRQMEERLQKDELRLKLAHKDIEARQREIEGTMTQVNDSLAAAEKMLGEIRQASQELAAKKKDVEKQIEVLEQLKQDAKSGAQAASKISAGWLQSMRPEVAAEVIRELANSGNMDFALQLLRYVEERNVAKILAAMNDAALAAELTERFAQRQDMETKQR